MFAIHTYIVNSQAGRGTAEPRTHLEWMAGRFASIHRRVEKPPNSNVLLILILGKATQSPHFSYATRVP